MFTNEFQDLSPESQEKVAKKVNKIYRWIQHSGGWNEITAMAFSYVVFKAFEDMGFDVVLKPRTTEAEEVMKSAEDSYNSGIIITD